MQYHAHLAPLWLFAPRSAANIETVTVIQPSLPWPWLTTPLCALVALNLFAHYYFVCTVPPGFADDPAPPPEPRTGTVWATPVP